MTPARSQVMPAALERPRERIATAEHLVVMHPRTLSPAIPARSRVAPKLPRKLPRALLNDCSVRRAAAQFRRCLADLGHLRCHVCPKLSFDQVRNHTRSSWADAASTLAKSVRSLTQSTQIRPDVAQSCPNPTKIAQTSAKFWHPLTNFDRTWPHSGGCGTVQCWPQPSFS